MLVMRPRGKMNTQQTETETRVSSTQYFPHIDLVLQSLRINRERLSSKSKIAIDARLLRLMLQTVAATLPFSEEFYMEHYPDIADAYAAGKIPNLHQHFLDSGYLEGRIGYPPEIDEKFYLSTYKDVSKAVAAAMSKTVPSIICVPVQPKGGCPMRPCANPSIIGWSSCATKQVATEGGVGG